MLSLQKKKFFSFFSLLNFSKLCKHPACKMNRNEKGGTGRKLGVLSEHLYENLYFNLQLSTFPYQLNRFIPFYPMQNIFPNSLINY